MKQIIYIAVFVILFMTACDKTGPANTQEQYDQYIFFSQSVETKASLIKDADDLAGKEFGVAGFMYPSTANSSWNAYLASNPTVTPNVFYEGNALTNVVKVTCDKDGDASYSPIQGWSNSRKYTFFAFYPVSNLVNTNGNEYTGGVPAIKHTLNLSNATDFKNSMIDVMAAPVCADIDGSSPDDNGVVSFNFQHCLSALGIKLKNASSGKITLTDIKLKISGIKYSEVIIPLDGSDIKLTDYTQTTALDVPLTFTEDESTIKNNDGVNEIELSDKLIMIPQSGDDKKLSVQVYVKYKREAGENTEYETTTAVLTTDLIKGSKHLINLKFTESTVEVLPTFDTEGWTPQDSVTDTFN